jgi:two-component system, CitB family, sensor kinase
VHGSNPERWAEVELLDELTEDGGVLHLVVADSGDGLAEETASNNDGGGSAFERIFTEGFSTTETGGDSLQDVHGQGFGLPLSRQLARRRGGDVWVAEPGQPGGPGAVFCARLPGTVAPKEPGEMHDE